MGRYQDYTDKVLKDLPDSSVAEFRRDAWKLANRHYTPGVVLDLYWTWCGLGALMAMFGFGIAGLWYDVQAWWIIAISGALLFLLVRRIVTRFKRAAAVRRALVAASSDIDKRAESGEIPERPTDWQGDLPLALQSDNVNKIYWRGNA